jgi:hypothetical protein
MSKKISQLTQAENREITPDDLILQAGLRPIEYSIDQSAIDTINAVLDDDTVMVQESDWVMTNNHITVNQFCKYFRCRNTYQLTDNYFNPGNIKSSVFESTVDFPNVTSLTFNEYGMVTDLEKTTGNEKVVDTIAGSFLSTPPSVEWQGYIDKTVESVQAATVIGGTIGSWTSFFDKSYSSYKKTVITYTQGRNDPTGNNAFDVCQHKIIIFWDYGGTKSVKACAIGQYPSPVGPTKSDTIPPLQYNTKTYIIGDLWFPVSGTYQKESVGNSIDPETSEFKVQLEIDIENSKINRIPLPSYDGELETTSISMTVESFV